MKGSDRLADRIRKDLDVRASARTYVRMWKAVADAHGQTRTIRSDGTVRVRGPLPRLTRIAAAIGVAAVLVAMWARFTAPAYAIEQTVEALRNVRLLHLVTRDEGGVMKEERWIEIGPDGRQSRYRQDTPPDFLVVEDGESTAVYHPSRKGVILYDRKDQQYQWISDLTAFFDNLRDEGRILEQNALYKDRRVHKVWWPAMGGECFIDPESKLPIAIGRSEISYEEPPAGTFVITVPDDYAVLDKRPGAVTGPVPQWLLDEDALRQKTDLCFDEGIRALAAGDYARAIEDLEFVVKHADRLNWAWFWLGRAYHGLGQYEAAVERFTRVLETLGQAYPCYYCYYARGVAYARLGRAEAAKADLRACLPSMIHALRTPSTGWLYELADDPLIQQGRDVPSNREIVAHMIGRLRLMVGQDFGYDPNATDEQNESAVRAWEQWFKEDGQIRLDLLTKGSP